MEETNRNPERWLQAVQAEADTTEHSGGHLKIFFGYAAGVGKTYSMLQAARAAKQRGLDVAAGYVEPHARPETAELLNGLETIPFRETCHNGIILREFDLDAALKRRPQLILLDELAHTNAPDCRHTKRYLDVRELLKAGIDVYTTVNVQHLESLHDTVASITGISVRERIPDAVFNEADQVELVDIEPEELMERLRAGKIYAPEQAERALENFFTIEHLTALREIALRRCADRVNLLVEKARVKSGEFRSDEHILVGLSSSPSNVKLIRTAARMAEAFRGALTALLVETPAFEELEEEDKKRLESNMDLARRLGAKIEIVHGDDIAFQIAEFARLSGVTKIVVGRSGVSRRFFRKPTLTEQLIAKASNLDLYIIPDRPMSDRSHRLKRSRTAEPFHPEDLFKSLGTLLAALLIGFGFQALHLADANIMTVFVLAVLIISVITGRRIYSMTSAVLSVLAFNFFFIEPKFTLLANDKNYPVTFLIMFAAAFISGTLASRLKDSARQSAHAAYRTQLLFDTNQLLQQAGTREEVLEAAAKQLVKLLDRDIVVYAGEGDKLGQPQTFAADPGHDLSGVLTDNEKAVAAWVYKNNTRAGAETDTLPNAKCQYLAIRVNRSVYGVVGIVMGDEPCGAFENSILLSILGECAMALESRRHAQEKEEAAVLAKNEQLRANLLRTISHDLRTPLTSISGNADNLLMNGEHFDEAAKQELYRDIYNDAGWLINLVENLLSVTRLEGGGLNLQLTPELLEEVTDEVIRHTARRCEGHELTVQHKDELLMARMDAKLIVQVLINLVDNAVKYTPPGTHITITTERRDQWAVISVADDGPGIPDSMKPHIFDMFYSGARKVADSRRSLGLGLALCRSIVAAHGGTMTVSDHHPRGAVFTFTLPVEEVSLNE